MDYPFAEDKGSNYVELAAWAAAVAVAYLPALTVILN